METINLTIQDYLEATQEYHHEENIYKAFKKWKKWKKNTNIIPTFRLNRQKTNNKYFTFCSNEAVIYINAYLQQRENIKNTDKLFKLHERYFSMLFAKVNDTLQLGNKGEYKRFRLHMLRKFHATQLYIVGMVMTKIDALQGRGKTKTHKAYFKDSSSFLKEEYIKCLPYLLIDEIEKAKTELEQQNE